MIVKRNIILTLIWPTFSSNLFFTHLCFMHLNKGRHGTDPWPTPVVFRYLSYSTTLAEHAIHRLQRRQPSAGQGHVCSSL